MSCYADNKLIKDTEAAKYDFENEKSSIFQKLDTLLRQIQGDPLEDSKPLQMTLTFVHNIMADENSDFADKLIRETCFINYLQFFAQQWDRLESDTKDYVLSIVKNMTRKMHKNEIKLGSSDDFDALVHLVKLHLGTAITE